MPDLSTRSTDHATFTIERSFAHPVRRVYTAFADAEAKRAWFVGPDGFESTDHQLDFRVGGTEHLQTSMPDGQVVTFDAQYRDMVEDVRIIYAYDMTIGGSRISVSIASLEFHAVDGGTRLVVTEHGIYLDGLDQAGDRERGTRELLDQLERSLDTAAKGSLS